MKLSDITYLLPELVLLVGAALVFLLDILWLRRKMSAEQRFAWLPGALATEFVSTNGRTFREPPREWRLGWKWSPPEALWMDSPQSLSADYVRQGVTGVSGQVYEPLLAYTIRPQILFPAYLTDRLTLAEAFYRAMPALSWQNIIIGDPLCRLE